MRQPDPPNTTLDLFEQPTCVPFGEAYADVTRNHELEASVVENMNQEKCT